MASSAPLKASRLPEYCCICVKPSTPERTGMEFSAAVSGETKPATWSAASARFAAASSRSSLAAAAAPPSSSALAAAASYSCGEPPPLSIRAFASSRAAKAPLSASAAALNLSTAALNLSAASARYCHVAFLSVPVNERSSRRSSAAACRVCASAPAYSSVRVYAASCSSIGRSMSLPSDSTPEKSPFQSIPIDMPSKVREAVLRACSFWSESLSPSIRAFLIFSAYSSVRASFLCSNEPYSSRCSRIARASSAASSATPLPYLDSAAARAFASAADCPSVSPSAPAAVPALALASFSSLALSSISRSSSSRCVRSCSMRLSWLSSRISRSVRAASRSNSCSMSAALPAASPRASAADFPEVPPAPPFPPPCRVASLFRASSSFLALPSIAAAKSKSAFASGGAAPLRRSASSLFSRATSLRACRACSAREAAPASPSSPPPPSAAGAPPNLSKAAFVSFSVAALTSENSLSADFRALAVVYVPCVPGAAET